MIYEVFKAVREKEGKLVSLYMKGPARLDYTLGKEIVSTTPIFVYVNIREAYNTVLGIEGFKLLLGSTTTLPVHLWAKSPQMLDIVYPYSREMVQDFWEKVVAGKENPLGNFYEMPTDQEAFGVYNFTPLHIIQ